jgi:uncharacterized membrane protein HdeD (DUF308 family)
MSETMPDAAVAQDADRLYGEVLILLGLGSAVAPLFAPSVAAWSLLLAGVVGVWWIALDRTPRGFVAGVAWVLITFGIGLHLAFHVIADAMAVGLSLGLGTILLGVAELALGIERPTLRRWGRPIMVAGGVGAIAFAIAVPIVWPDIPPWTADAAVAILFVTFGAALLIGPRCWRRSP